MSDRFRRNDLLFYAALICIFAGVWIEFSLGIALIVLGSTAAITSVATAFFVTALSARVGSGQ